jgi:DinB family protein
MDYLNERRREYQTTLRVLRAYPEDQRHLKPAEKSRSAAELVRTFVNEERVLTSLLNTGITDPGLLTMDVPGSMTNGIELWQNTVATNDGLLAKVSPERWESVVTFYGMQIPLVQACWFELFDHIHHRGQFSVYLRLAGARVPSIYGPTADEPVA